MPFTVIKQNGARRRAVGNGEPDRPAPRPVTPTPAPALDTASSSRWGRFYGAGDTPALTPAPAFSVIMPVYNMAHRGLPRAIESVLNQTFTSWELITVDDGSTDGSADILAWYAARDPRIRVHRQPENRKVCQARNAGYQLARGVFLAHLDGDDEWLPDWLEVAFATLRERPEAGVLFAQKIMGGKAQFNYEIPFADGWEAVNRLCVPPAQTVILRRSLVGFVGGNDPDTPCLQTMAQDWDQWIRAFAVGEAAWLNRPGYILHHYPDSLTAKAARGGAWKPADLLCKERAETLGAARERMKARRIRVLHLGFDAPARGAQQMLLSLLRHTDPAEFELRLALKHPQGELTEAFEAVCPVSDLGAVRGLAEWADVVHLHSYGWEKHAGLPAGLPVAKILATEHSCLCRYDGPGVVTKVWEGRPPAPGSELPAAYRPVGVEIPNPVDLPSTGGDLGPLAIPDGPLVLALIPFQYYKGADVVLEAFDLLTQARPELVCAVVGVRREHDDNWQESVAKIEALQARGAKVLWRGPQDRAIVRALCERAGALLHLPRTEALGMVLLEAQAVGCPVVTSAVGGTRQAVHYGRAVPTEHPKAAADAVLAVLGQRVPEAIREEILWRHHPRRVAACYAEAYRAIRLKGA
jgi:glycosyltransferase involved in cell wall biosynthesis